MNNKPMITTVAVVAVVASLAAFAQSGPGGGWGEPGQRGPGRMFQQADTDNNGSVSQQEFDAFRSQRQANRPQFTDMDINSDGQLTMDEVQAFMAERREQGGWGGRGWSGHHGKGHPGGRGPDMSAFDSDGDGAVTLAEFEAGVAEHRAERQAAGYMLRGDRDPAAMFSRLDTNGDGQLTTDEIQQRQRGWKKRG